jgi:hypothetical protein
MRKALVGRTSAYALAGALMLEALAPAAAGPIPGVEALLGKTAPSPIVHVYYHHHHHYYGGVAAGLIAGGLLGAAIANPYYYGPPPYPYYDGPVYYGPPPVYYAPPPQVVYAPPPGPNGPVRQCWVATDKDRGFGYWRPC